MKKMSSRPRVEYTFALGPDPALRPVVATTSELGWRYHASHPNLEASANVYSTRVRDDIFFIASSVTGGYFQNIGGTRRNGLELAPQRTAPRGPRAYPTYGYTGAPDQTTPLLGPTRDPAGDAGIAATPTAQREYGFLRAPSAFGGLLSAVAGPYRTTFLLCTRSHGDGPLGADSRRPTAHFYEDRRMREAGPRFRDPRQDRLGWKVARRGGRQVYPQPVRRIRGRGGPAAQRARRCR